MSSADIRKRLREATFDVHQRLHGHEGFNAVATGAIDRSDYRLLLGRLWGFHHPFERIAGKAVFDGQSTWKLRGRGRCAMLEADLLFLGVTPVAIANLPECRSLGQPESWAELMGALYVVEGSSLGGLHLARALAPLFDSDSDEGRRFFLGYGERHGAMWRALLGELERCATTSVLADAVVDGALQTFAVFETWMADWRIASSGSENVGRSPTLEPAGGY